MRIPVVRFGDATTTGGKVHAMRDNMTDGGKAIALHGERATCGNCKGTWPIVGTGYRTRNDGQPAAFQDDKVLCPWGNNRVISTSEGCFYDRTSDEEDGAVRTSFNASTVPQPARHDGQYGLKNREGQLLANVRYRIVVDGERVITGNTGTQARTGRIKKDAASKLKLYTTGEIDNE